MRILRVAVIVSLLLTAPSFAWCYKEHIQFARIAASRLLADSSTPPEMKKWLEESIPARLDMDGEKEYFLHTHLGMDIKGYETGLLHWTYMPDVRANDKSFPDVKEFEAPEQKMHFLDMEIFLPGKTPRVFKSDLTGKPPAEAIPKDWKDERYKQAGFLPVRIPQIYGELVKAIREGRLHPTGPDDENNAEVYAGYLAHYLADNTQPQHATVDFRSHSFFKVQRKAPNVHSSMEYQMCDDERDYPELRQEFWPLFTQQLDQFSDPVVTDDLFVATIQVARTSYDALPLIGEAAVKSVKPSGGNKADTIDCEQFFRYEGTINGRPTSVMKMKARQTAWAVKRIERVWKQAWLEAKRG